LGHAFSSEAQLAFASAVTFGALATSALLLAWIAAARGWRVWREHQVGQREGAWREALYQATEDPETAVLPPITRLDLPHFLILFNHLGESLRGAAADNVARLLQRHGLHTRALSLMRRRSLRLRLIAITALGHLREERAWAALEAATHDRGPVTSFAAARALLRIEPRRALDVLGPSIIERDDWPLARIATIFQELGPAVITPPMVNWLVGRPRKGLDRVVKLARLGHRSRIASIVRGWLSSSDSPEVIVAALDYVEEDSDLPWVRGAARHEDWHVRMAAARALARVGQHKELAVLLDLLRDPVWWVRYHAAQAMTSLHGLAPHELENLRENARDAFAADMLGQALAEMRRR